MSLNLKQILNSVLGESGFLEKTAFAGSSDSDDKQMVAIANRMATSVLEFYNWSALINDFSLTITTNGGTMTDDGSGTKTSYALPADFSNLIPDSAWEVDGSRRIELPTSQSRWYMYKFSAYSDGGTIRARIMGDQIEVYNPQLGDSFNLAYISEYPVVSAGAVPQKYFVQDDDLFVLDEEVLIKGIQWKWGHAKMMPQWQDWKQDYLSDMNAAIGRDTGGRTIGGMAQDQSLIESRQPYYPLYR